MDRFLTWPLILLTSWCGFLLHTITNVDTIPWFTRLAFFLFVVGPTAGFGVWYGYSIKQGDNQ